MSSSSQSSDRPYLPFRGVENDGTAILPLDPELREIRCVVLLPGSGDDPIACELVYTNINEKSDTRVPYIVLSYCWGDIKDTVEITLYDSSTGLAGACQKLIGSPFRITRNLYIALLALWNKTRQCLWIDALCINQQDLREKTHQVLLMGKIYSSAESVLVWLGPEDKYSRFLMRTWTAYLRPAINSMEGEAVIDLYDQLFKDPHPLWTGVAQDKVLIQLALDLNDEGMDEAFPNRYKNALWISFNNILNRPWWSRIWIVQEVFLAPRSEGGGRKVEFRLGDSTLHWQDILHAKTIFPIYNSALSHKVYHSWNMLIEWDKNLWYVNIDFLLTFTSSFCASDPRDKLFALLQLASDTKECMYDPLIRPDYTKSLADVVDDLVRWKPLLSTSHFVFHVRETLKDSLRNQLPQSYGKQ